MPSIGHISVSNPWILAPMAGVSEKPFRVMALEFGAGLAPTELISAKGLEYQNRRTREYLDHSDREVPFWVQLFGGEPDSMAIAAEASVKAGAHMLDINMGCPVKKVTKTGAGSALLCDTSRAADVVRAMRKAVGEKVPVTAKIRAGWDSHSINCEDMGRRLEDAGVGAISLHARTRAQGYSGKADWSLIRRLKDAVKVPVIGNGDVKTVADAKRMQAETGCDFVMLGRAALGNPWIFRSLCAGMDLPAPTPPERMETIVRHLREHVEFIGDETRAIRQFRQHIIWYSKGLAGGAAFRDSVMRHDTYNAVMDLCLQFFGYAAPDASREGDGDDGVDYATALG